MATADLISRLIRSGSVGDQDEFRAVAGLVIAHEREKGRIEVAKRYERCLSMPKRPAPGAPMQMLPTQVGDDSILRIAPSSTLDDLILPPHVRQECLSLVQEHARAEDLRRHGLEPRNRVLLVGPPGTGKTSLAGAIASLLDVPFFVVNYDCIVGSLLGETGSRLDRMFKTLTPIRCVLFFDEFEVLVKDRAEKGEAGEMRRVVSSLLVHLDRIPSRVIIVAATNRPEMIDSAAWRRFQIKVKLPSPTQDQRIAWLDLFESRTGFSLGDRDELLEHVKALSIAEMEILAVDIMRTKILDDSLAIVDIVASRIARGFEDFTA